MSPTYVLSQLYAYQGMMGMSMGMMGMMGMMGSGQKTSPPAEKPPDLKREEHIQLGTNFVTRLEVRRQPLAQIRSYLERQMGLTESETNEVLRRSGIDPTAGQAEQISGREAYLASRGKSERGQSSRAPPADAEQGDTADETGLVQSGQVPASLAYAAAAAVLAPPQRTWQSWLFGPSVEEATLKAYQSYQQQLLQQAYSATAQHAPSTIVLQPGDAGAAAAMGTWTSRRLLLVAVVGLWLLARAGVARWLLYRLAAGCGACPIAHASAPACLSACLPAWLCQPTSRWLCTIRGSCNDAPGPTLKEKQGY